MIGPRTMVEARTLGIGDMLLVQSRGGAWWSRLASWAIRLAAWLRKTPPTWNHLVIVTRVVDGQLEGIEASGEGIRRVGQAKMTRLAADGPTISNRRQPKTDLQRYLLGCLAEAILGTPYDYPAIVMDAMNALNILRTHADYDQQWQQGVPAPMLDCSAAYDWMAEQVGLESPRPDRACTPADWAALILERGWS